MNGYDTWLLLSVVLAASDEGAELDGIVSVGDAINHAIFSFHEIDGGLARLRAGGFVRVEHERVFSTDKAERLYEGLKERGGNPVTVMGAIGREIGAPAWSASHDPNRADPAWSLGVFSEADLDRACVAYRERFANALRDPEKQGR